MTVPRAAGGLTDAVKQELAKLPLGDEPADAAELAALVRAAGALTVRGGRHGLALDLRTTSGATARRAFSLIAHRYDLRPELRVRAPAGVQRRTLYGIGLVAGVSHVARDLGLLDDAGRLTDGLRAVGPGQAAAAVRGAFLGAGSVSAPDRPPHLEIVVTGREVADQLATFATSLLDDGRASVVPARTDGSRVVVKSGAAIGELLVAMGAADAYLHWEERRVRRQVRGDATRLANADAANLRRSVEAAAGQVRAVETVVADLGWDGIDEDLRVVALARLANPDASLGELGELTDPPCSKSAVHRRLRRLEQLASEISSGDEVVDDRDRT